jgi:small ligand-binding sensory domain FIST
MHYIDVSHGLQAFARNQMKNSASDAILGGLLFQCTARGKDFYNKPNVDSTLFKVRTNLINMNDI